MTFPLRWIGSKGDDRSLPLVNAAISCALAIESHEACEPPLPSPCLCFLRRLPVESEAETFLSKATTEARHCEGTEDPCTPFSGVVGLKILRLRSPNTRMGLDKHVVGTHVTSRDAARMANSITIDMAADTIIDNIVEILSSQFHLQTCPSIISTHLLPPKTLKFQPFNRNFTNKSYGRSSIRCRSPKSFGDREKNDQRIHNKKKSIIESIPELLLGDEIPNFSFSLPAMLILLGKEQIYEMINHFITFLKKHIEFIVRPAADGGADVGIKWYIEWKDKDLHLGRGCTVDSSHVYYGRIFLRNGKNLLDPLLKWKPTKLIGKEVPSRLQFFLHSAEN
ncbi:hypothetical protein IEQ34_006262 [Dendrobium chrysotoxum]|uniref:Uncharacterized protein n=1 Tax=Dendrobium chrysotoxum TaxID=161865 RepID=A0AAV7HEF3_DENCH|nr:hypothetical protein IEQ34_006262 [Dendrobium chrysotoxum]